MSLYSQTTREFFSGKTSEQTAKKNLRPKQKEEVYMVVTEYDPGKERKEGGGSFFRIKGTKRGIEITERNTWGIKLVQVIVFR